jgi:hypothetical protein
MSTDKILPQASHGMKPIQNQSENTELPYILEHRSKRFLTYVWTRAPSCHGSRYHNGALQPVAQEKLLFTIQQRALRSCGTQIHWGIFRTEQEQWLGDNRQINSVFWKMILNNVSPTTHLNLSVPIRVHPHLETSKVLLVLRLKLSLDPTAWPLSCSKLKITKVLPLLASFILLIPLYKAKSSLENHHYNYMLKRVQLLMMLCGQM